MSADALITKRIFQKLLRLAPDLREMHESAFSGLPGYRRLSVDVRARADDHLRLRLSHYCLYPTGEKTLDPTLEVAVSFDREEAEALTYADAFRHEAAYPSDGGPPDAEVQARLNRFLDSWLDRLRDLGHVIRNQG